MNENLIKYKDQITKVFSLVVEVLTVSRSLKSISLDLKLMAINGIVQAAKVGTNQGHSLITLSGFLATLPQQIAPELEDLETLSRRLSREITICSIAVRRFILYSIALRKTVDSALSDGNKYRGDNIDLLSVKVLDRIEKNEHLINIEPVMKTNLVGLAQKNLELIKTLNRLLEESHITIRQSRDKIERIRRNGFIANYMGSNISIESTYLRKNQESFHSLVSNIKETVQILNEKLDMIIDKINDSELLLEKLIKSRIIN
ncbi:MAG: hypothetical protein QG635_653 [Bacteroidota bacterium]|nr:hypothetical protein [Bacteroidota bacterium]